MEIIPTQPLDTEYAVPLATRMAMLNLVAASEHDLQHVIEHGTDAIAGPELHHDRVGRQRQIIRDVITTGTYTRTTAEREYDAKRAWFLEAKCAGRLGYDKLEVRDYRDRETPQAVAEACVQHLRDAANNRNKPIATILPRGTVLDNPQLLQYAGYATAEGGHVGYRNNIDLTQTARSMGWQGTGGDFDMLPLIIRMPGYEPYLFEIPKEHQGEHVYQEVPLESPDPADAWLADMGLQYYGTPALIMDLEAGAASDVVVLSGWFVTSEVVADVVLEDRLGKLPDLRAADLRRRGPGARRYRTQDGRLLTMLDEAVDHSYKKAGVRIVDSDVIGHQFMTFVRESQERSGQLPPIDTSYVESSLGRLTTPTYVGLYPHKDFEVSSSPGLPRWRKSTAPTAVHELLEGSELPEDSGGHKCPYPHA